MTEDADEIEVDWESPESDRVQCDNCAVIAPSGWEAFAEATGALLVRVQSKNGDVEVLTELGKAWHTAGKAVRNGSLTVVKD